MSKTMPNWAVVRATVAATAKTTKQPTAIVIPRIVANSHVCLFSSSQQQQNKQQQQQRRIASTKQAASSASASIEDIWKLRTQEFLQHSPKQQTKINTKSSLSQQPHQQSSSAWKVERQPDDSNSNSNHHLDYYSASWWHEMDGTIRYWARQRPLTVTALQNSWQLFWDIALPAALQQQQQQQQQLIQTLLNVVLDQWRLCHKYNIMKRRGGGGTAAVTTEDVWKQLKELKDIPNVRTFSIFLTALQHITTNVDPEDVLEHMMQSNYPHQQPNIVTWNAALTVWAKRSAATNDPRAPDKAKALLERMTNKGDDNNNNNTTTNIPDPNSISLANVLDTYASLDPEQYPHACENAQAIWDDYTTHETITVCSICYLHLIRAWCNSKRDDGADKAYAILQSMVDAYEQSLSSSSTTTTTTTVPIPTRHCFSACMSGFARRGYPEQAEELLRQLQQLYERTGLPEFQPTTATLNSVLEAYARIETNKNDNKNNNCSSKEQAAQWAQNLLERIFQMASANQHLDNNNTSNNNNKNNNINNNKTAFTPDTTLVNTVIHAWAECGAPERAEEVFQTYLVKSEDNNSSTAFLSPDQYSYTTLMKAWARSDSSNPREAAERCEAILQHMWDEYYDSATSTSNYDNNGKRPNQKLKPNHITYATVLYAWSRASAAGDREAPYRADAIYEDMMEKYKQQQPPSKGDKNLKPSQTVYNSLITTWARASGDPRVVASKVQHYFDEMRHGYMAGDGTLRPGAKIYNAMIDAKKRCGDGEGAEVILKQMMDDYNIHKNPAAKPNRLVFNNVMSAWANSQTTWAPQRVEAILKHMTQLADENGWKNCQPDDVSFTILLDSWAKSGRDDAPEQAEAILRHMQKLWENGDPTTKPNSFCYANVLNAWARSSRNNPNAPLRAEALFEEMLQKYEQGDTALKPTSFVYNSLLTTWARSSRPDAPRKALAILNEMEDRFQSNYGTDRPDGFHFSAVISAFARIGDTKNAEALLNRIVNAKGARPNKACFNSVIKAYERSNLPDAAERAESLLIEMIEIHNIFPDAATYTMCISCWHKQSVSSGNADAYKRAKNLMEEMMRQPAKRGTRHNSPNASTFLALLRTLTSCHDSRLDKTIEAEEIMEMMNAVGVRPSDTIAYELQKCY